MKGFSGLTFLLIFSCFADISSKGDDALQIETTTEAFQDHMIQPYIDTVAEKWAFDLQMTRILKESEGKIQEKARSLILKREQDHAEIPDETIPVIVKVSEEDHHYKLFLADGVINGLEGVIFTFEKILSYEDLDVVFSGEVKYPHGFKVIQTFISTTNDTIMGNGKITAFVEKLNFNIKARLNLKVGNIQLEHFDRNCQSNVKVNFEGRGPMELQLIQTITRLTKELFAGNILRDVHKLTMTAIDGAFMEMEGYIELPQYDYGKNYVNFDYVGHRFRPNTTRCSKKSKNPVVTRAMIRTSGIGINFPENLPFIQNDPEMKSFFDLLRNGTNKYLNNVFEKTKKTLQHRGLQLAKLADIERTFVADGSSGADPIGSLNISNGWISDITNISRGGMDMVYVHDDEIHISARLHLPKKIEVNQAFHLDLGSYKGAGGLRGTTDYMIYMVKIAVNLKTFETTLLDIYLICIGEVKYQVAVIETRDSSYEVGLLEAAVDSFNHSVSSEIGKLIRHGLEYAISKIDVKVYLPPWDYSRVCDRKGNLDPKYRMCEKGDIALALRKKSGKGYNAKIQSNPVHFINTELELQAFREQLFVYMNDYLREMINKASRIITIQDLKKIRYKYYVRPWNAKDPEGNYKFGTVSIFGGVLEDLSAMFQGQDVIDSLVFDDSSIVMNAQIPFWWLLKFQANASIIQDNKLVSTHIKGELTSLMYYLKMRVDFFKKVTIEEFRVECLGEGKFWTKFSYNDNWMRESLMEHLNGFLVQHIWPEANQILKRAFHDAINGGNISAYLPNKNYEAQSNENLPPRKKFWEGLRPCKDVTQAFPTIRMDLKQIKVVEFGKILPLMTSETLRRNLDKELKKNSHSYLNHLWSLTKTRVLKELEFGRSPPKRISFYPEGLGGEQEAILELEDGWFKSFSHSDLPNLFVRDTEYGENSSFIILMTEDVEMFKAILNFTLQISDEHVHGSIIMSAEGIRNLVAVQFFILSNRMEIVDYDLLCLNQTIATITGLPSDYKDLRTVIMAEIIKASFIPLYKDYLIEVMDAFDAVVREDNSNVPYLSEYITEKHLFGVAVHHEPEDIERQIKRNQVAIQCHLDEEPDMLEVKQFPPFIGTEAEWVFFSKLLSNSMNLLKTDLDYFSLRYVILNDLVEVKIPDISGENNIENSHEVKIPTKFIASNGTLKYSFKSITPEKIYFDKETNEVVLLAYLNFKNSITLHYNINVNSLSDDENGEVFGYVEELIYSYKVHLHLPKKHFRLENLHLKCVKGINMKISGISNGMPQLEEHVTKIFRKAFMTTVLDDIEKFLTMALLTRIMQFNEEDSQINGNFFVPEWNYEKDYSAILDTGIDKDFNICPTKLNFFQGPDGLIYYSE